MTEIRGFNKDSVQDLAYFGGTPLFSTPLHVGRPNIGDRKKFHDLIDQVLERRILTNNGPCVQQFEKELCAYLGVKHCILMCNATIALELAIRALDMTGEVIVPSFTFIATAHSLEWQKITPVFCDIDPHTHNIDPEKIQQHITPRTSGIIGVHVWGRPCDIEALETVARKNKLRIMFDAAHAFGVSHRGTMIGNFGDCEVLSFHGTKFFNTFEGGAVTTNNDELAKKLRLMKNFGFRDFDEVIYIGTNGKMSELSAAMGLVNLQELPNFLENNLANYTAFQRELSGIPGVRMNTYNQRENNNYQYIVTEIDSRTTQVHRNDIVKIFHAENIRARRYFYPGCHRMEPYRSLYPFARMLLPETERLSDQVFVLPTGGGVSYSEIKLMSELLHFIIDNRQEIAERLSDNRLGEKYHART